jgi:hypothetical protein
VIIHVVSTSNTRLEFYACKAVSFYERSTAKTPSWLQIKAAKNSQRHGVQTMQILQLSHRKANKVEMIGYVQSGKCLKDLYAYFYY